MRFRRPKPAHSTPRDLHHEEIIEVKSVGAFSWSPGRVSENLPCTQVHLRIEIDASLPLVMRLKSRAACDELINALIAERDFVWPEGHEK